MSWIEFDELRQLKPGVQMYHGKITFVYNGEVIYDWKNDKPLVYGETERKSWRVIIVLPGVSDIPFKSFSKCENLKIVIMPTVKHIRRSAFMYCKRLRSVVFSENLEVIGSFAFAACIRLRSIFIPLSCTHIFGDAFFYCEKLLICSVGNPSMGIHVFDGSELMKRSPFTRNRNGRYNDYDAISRWVTSLNGDTDEFSLHRACASCTPNTEDIYEIFKNQGLKSLAKTNEIGVTPSQYLEQNPFSDMSAQKLINRYVLEMMGEIPNISRN